MKQVDVLGRKVALLDNEDIERRNDKHKGISTQQSRAYAAADYWQLTISHQYANEYIKELEFAIRVLSRGVRAAYDMKVAV